MIYLGLWLLVLGVSMTEAANFNQQTNGWCSPVIGQAGRDVYFNCQGIDPQAMLALNERLNKTTLDLQQKTREADEWARKYHELFMQAKATQDNQLGREAEDLLRKGKLDDAANLLQRSTISRARFLTINDGMSLQDVVGILGRPGVQGASAGSVINYSWHNPDMSLGVVLFNNGRVIAKNPGSLR